jgi:hypothetical protein
MMIAHRQTKSNVSLRSRGLLEISTTLMEAAATDTAFRRSDALLVALDTYERQDEKSKTGV